MTLVHWDDVEGFDIPDDVQPLGGRWQRLADAAGSVRVGVQRVRLAPEQWRGLGLIARLEPLNYVDGEPG